jgi:hypothetical protein
MKRLIPLLPCLLLAACGTSPVRETVVPVQESAVAGTTLDLKNTENVRYSEQLKAYPVGRYADPNNPEVMHEAHTLYRAEQSPRWNLNPNTPTVVPLGPALAVADNSKQVVTITAAELEEMRRSRQALEATYEQNKRLTQEIEKLRQTYAQKNGESASTAPEAGTPKVETNSSSPEGTTPK